MVLVTGATGHLGNVLVRKLVEQGEKVRVLVLPGESLLSLQGMLVEVLVGDVLDYQSVSKAMKGVNTAFHLAGIIAISPGSETVMKQVNVEGVRNVARAALESGIDRLVHVSSIHAFHREPHGTVIDENTPLALDSTDGSYDRTKAEGTSVVIDYVRKGLNAVVVCPTGIIGRHDYLGSEMGKTIISFTDRYLDILVDGAFDFVDVRDVVDGLLKARDKGRTGEIYILSGTRISVEELHRITQESAGVSSPKVLIPIRMAMFAVSIFQGLFRLLKRKTRYTLYSLQTLIDNSVFSSTKAFQELGYRPRPLRESVEDFLTWYQKYRKPLRTRINKMSLKKKSRRLAGQKG